MKRPDRWIDARGYVRLKRPKKTHPGGFIYEHRAVMAELLGRPLLSTEDVHHRNEVRSDNAPTNLQLTTRPPHTGSHNRANPKRKKGMAPKNPGAYVRRQTATARRRANRRRARAMRSVWRKRRLAAKVPTFAPTRGVRQTERRPRQDGVTG